MARIHVACCPRRSSHLAPATRHALLALPFQQVPTRSQPNRLSKSTFIDIRAQANNILPQHWATCWLLCYGSHSMSLMVLNREIQHALCNLHLWVSQLGDSQPPAIASLPDRACSRSRAMCLWLHCLPGPRETTAARSLPWFDETQKPWDVEVACLQHTMNSQDYLCIVCVHNNCNGLTASHRVATSLCNDSCNLCTMRTLPWQTCQTMHARSFWWIWALGHKVMHWATGMQSKVMQHSELTLVSLLHDSGKVPSSRFSRRIKAFNCTSNSTYLARNTTILQYLHPTARM